MATYGVHAIYRGIEATQLDPSIPLAHSRADSFPSMRNAAYRPSLITPNILTNTPIGQ